LLRDTLLEASSGFSCNESKYGIDAKAISGIILNDAAGLNMKDYLEKNPPTDSMII
jgi:hypothetical protein